MHALEQRNSSISDGMDLSTFRLAMLLTNPLAPARRGLIMQSGIFGFELMGCVICGKGNKYLKYLAETKQKNGANINNFKDIRNTNYYYLPLHQRKG